MAKTNSEEFNILVQMVQKAQNLLLWGKKKDLFPFGQQKDTAVNILCFTK